MGVWRRRSGLGTLESHRVVLEWDDREELEVVPSTKARNNPTGSRSTANEKMRWMTFHLT